MDDLIRVQNRCLEELRLHVSCYLDAPLDGPDVEMATRFLPERMAYQLTARLRLASEVLNDNGVVAEWPATWWDHLKARLGFAHNTRKVRVHETVVYSRLKLPPGASHLIVRYVEDAPSDCHTPAKGGKM